MKSLLMIALLAVSTLVATPEKSRAESFSFGFVYDRVEFGKCRRIIKRELRNLQSTFSARSTGTSADSIALYDIEGNRGVDALILCERINRQYRVIVVVHSQNSATGSRVRDDIVAELGYYF
ncbi:MAG: hypothetical protein MRY74_13020 [Neomegalonema sp.]|nr:hypothetical protein [Neomegalonema sp.]